MIPSAAANSASTSTAGEGMAVSSQSIAHAVAAYAIRHGKQASVPEGLFANGDHAGAGFGEGRNHASSDGMSDTESG